MRNPDLIAERNKKIEEDFNRFYKEIKFGSHAAKYNVAVAKTAAKYYLSIRRIQDILCTPKEPAKPDTDCPLFPGE